MAIHSKETIPFEIKIMGNFGVPLPGLIYWDRIVEVEKESFLVIRENVSIAVAFSSKTENPESSGNLNIETSRYNNDGELVQENIPLLEHGEMKWLYQSQDGDTSMYPWRMGYYLITVIFNEVSFYSGIQVIPNNMTVDQVRIIHQYLEEQVENVCYDLIISQQGYSNDILTETPERWYYDYMPWLIDNKSEIMATLNLLERNVHNEIVTSYKISQFPSKMTVVSERWSESCKGLAHSQGAPQSHYLNQKKLLEEKTNPNKWIKYILIRWKQNLTDILRYLQVDLENVWKKESEFREVLMERDKWMPTSDTHSTYRRGQKQRFRNAESQLRKLSQQKALLIQWAVFIKSVNSRFSLTLLRSPFSEIEMGVQKPLLKNRYYYKIDQLFHESLHIRKVDGDYRRYKPLIKRTWQIYEYFVLLEVMKMFEDANFRTVSGFPTSGLRSFIEQGILEGSVYKMESDEAIIYVSYSKLLPMTPEDAAKEHLHFYAYQEHRWPDIRIDYYRKKDKSSISFISSLVVEIKDSKFHNLYKPGTMNRIRSQLTAYSSIFYCGPYANIRRQRRTAVDQVICVHSGQGEGSNPITIRSPHTFIRLFPDFVNENEIDIIGIDELQSELTRWLTDSANEDE